MPRMFVCKDNNGSRTEQIASSHSRAAEKHVEELAQDQRAEPYATLYVKVTNVDNSQNFEYYAVSFEIQYKATADECADVTFEENAI